MPNLLLDLDVTSNFILKARGERVYIQQLATLSGVSTRTLRYYDEIGLLVPYKNQETGYRMYSQEHIDDLQQILFYRELEMPLADIKVILRDRAFQHLASLKKHQQALEQKQQHIARLLATVEQTIQSIEEGTSMSNEQKFEAFKEQIIEENEKKYGTEIRQKHGEESVMASYGMVKNMSEAQFEAATQLEQQLFERLREAMVEGDETSDLAVEVAELHKRWLSFYWPKYTKGAHVGLAQMYVADERFIAYYDTRVAEGATAFLTAAIEYYSGM